MKKEHEEKLDNTQASMLRRMCVVLHGKKQKEMQRNERILGLESVGFVIKNGGLRLFGSVECKNDADLGEMSYDDGGGWNKTEGSSQKN